MKNSIREIELSMQENWPECAESMSLSLLRIARINDLFKHSIEACVDSHQLQHADFSVLATLRRSPSPYCLTPTDLCQSMLFSSGGVTKILGRLVAAELIERIDNPNDRRSQLVKLNAKGKQLAETIMPELHTQGNQLLQGLTGSETKQLENLLEKVLMHIESEKS